MLKKQLLVDLIIVLLICFGLNDIHSTEIEVRMRMKVF